LGTKGATTAEATARSSSISSARSMGGSRLTSRINSGRFSRMALAE
jgi:hypothetical protein